MRAVRFALLFLAACSGTDTGNPPVIDFTNSGCIERLVAKAGPLLQSLDDGSRYDGLSCIVFDRPTPETLRVMLTNYVAGCGADKGWTPHAERRDDGGLDIVLEDDDCALLRCASCIYDLSFTVAMSESLPDGELRIVERGCEVEKQMRGRLPLSQASGLACNYTDRTVLSARASGNTGERMLCGASAPTAPGSCDPGLVCTQVGEPGMADQGERCLTACTSAAQCADFERCEAGACVLAATPVEYGP